MGEPAPRVIPTQIHGRYLVEAGSGPGRHALIVGFHGYGETAEAHLEKLRRLPGSVGFVLVSVQSLHLFYTKTGDVVGSWMTKLGREQAIADNIRYVASVVAEVKRDFLVSDHLVYVGFSQGAAMAYRAAARSGHACHGLIVLGGDMPPEIAEDPEARLPPVLVGRGQRDEWFTQEKLGRDLAALERKGVPPRSLVFDGGHEWTQEFFEETGEFLRHVTEIT